MKLMALLDDTFPNHRTDGSGLYVWTRRGDILSGTVKKCDDNGLVLDTPHGTVLVVARSIVAISDRREALRPDPAHPPGGRTST